MFLIHFQARRTPRTKKYNIFLDFWILLWISFIFYSKGNMHEYKTLSMGPTFFEKKFFLDQIMMIWSIQTLKNVPKHFQTRGFHHTPPRKKSEMGQNLLIFGKSSNLYRDLAWKWLSSWVQLFFLKKKFFSTR